MRSIRFPKILEILINYTKEIFRSKRKNVIILALLGVVILIYFLTDIDSSLSTTSGKTQNNRLVIRNNIFSSQITDLQTYKKHRTYQKQQCTPQKVMFLKVHKAGSTSIRILLKAHANTHNLTMSLQRYGAWIGGYPGTFKAKFHELDTNYFTQGTDMVFDHLRYDRTEIDKVLSEPKTHKRIAIIREPFGQFKSSFNYFYLSHQGEGKFMKKRKMQPEACFGDPYYTVLDSETGSFNEFIDLIYENQIQRKVDEFLEPYPWAFRANNSQSFDFDHMEPEDIFKEFDLVLVLDRFKESLVLLKHEICADWKDIVPFALWSANSKSYDDIDPTKMDLSERNQNFIKENLINLDEKIYKMANHVLDDKIAKFPGGEFEVQYQIEKYFTNLTVYREKFRLPDLKEKYEISMFSSESRRGVVGDVSEYIMDNYVTCNDLL